MAQTKKKSDEALAQLVARAERAVAHRHFTIAARQKTIERLVLNPKLLEEAEARNAARGRAKGQAQATTRPKHKPAKPRPSAPVKTPEQTHRIGEKVPSEKVKPKVPLAEQLAPVNPTQPLSTAKPVSAAHQHLIDAHASLVDRDTTIAREIERLEALKQERQAIAQQLDALQRALQVFEAGATTRAGS